MQKSWHSLHSFLVILFVSVSFISPAYAKNNITPLSGPSVINSEPGGILEQVLLVYNKYIADNGNSFSTSDKLSDGELDKALGLMKELYITAQKTGDAHGAVALLIKKGLPKESLSEAFKGDLTQISEDASKFMAQAREQLIEDTLLKVLAEPEKVISGGTETGKAVKIMWPGLTQVTLIVGCAVTWIRPFLSTRWILRRVPGPVQKIWTRHF